MMEIAAPNINNTWQHRVQRGRIGIQLLQMHFVTTGAFPTHS